MKLDREYQKHILRMLEEKFPLSLELADAERLRDGRDGLALAANVSYLEQHGLIHPGSIRPPTFTAPMDVNIRALGITHRGMDFLADDGGLSAILGVVTIKLHEDTLKELVAMKIQQSDLPPADKSIWLDALKKLPAEATKHLAVKLMDAGLAHAPDALRQVGSMLGLH